MLGVDTSSVFKRPVHCFRCADDFFFTLGSIAESQALVCPHCGSGIDLDDEAYRPLVAKVRATIADISDPKNGSRFGRPLTIVMNGFHLRG